MAEDKDPIVNPNNSKKKEAIIEDPFAFLNEISAKYSSRNSFDGSDDDEDDDNIVLDDSYFSDNWFGGLDDFTPTANSEGNFHWSNSNNNNHTPFQGNHEYGLDQESTLNGKAKPNPFQGNITGLEQGNIFNGNNANPNNPFQGNGLEQPNIFNGNSNNPVNAFPGNGLEQRNIFNGNNNNIPNAFQGNSFHQQENITGTGNALQVQENISNGNSDDIPNALQGNGFHQQENIMGNGNTFQVQENTSNGNSNNIPNAFQGNDLPQENITNENRKSNGFPRINLDFGNPIRIPIWPFPPSPYYCTFCQLLREYFHVNEYYTWKLEIHGRLGIITHGVLTIDKYDFQALDSCQYYMFDFSQDSISNVRRFLERYCNDRRREGYTMLPDPMSEFYRAISVGLDRENVANSSQQPAQNQEIVAVGEITRRNIDIRIQRERVRKIRLKDLVGVFHLPIKIAASIMGLCMSSLKFICRREFLAKWPYKKIKGIKGKIARAQERWARINDPNERAIISTEIQMLQQRLDNLYLVLFREQLLDDDAQNHGAGGVDGTRNVVVQQEYDTNVVIQQEHDTTGDDGSGNIVVQRGNTTTTMTTTTTTAGDIDGFQTERAQSMVLRRGYNTRRQNLQSAVRASPIPNPRIGRRRGRPPARQVPPPSVISAGGRRLAGSQAPPPPAPPSGGGRGRKPVASHVPPPYDSAS